MDERRERVIGMMAAILAASPHISSADDLFGGLKAPGSRVELRSCEGFG
jgi:hypothetical protein